MLLLGLMLIYPTFVTGQESETFLYRPSQKLPIDENVKVGKLDNGMTYYIRHNEVPAQKAELRLVFNAGSILETDEEQGLSHFLEHMSFTGTSSFPGTELVNNWKESAYIWGVNSMQPLFLKKQYITCQSR